MMGVTPAVIVEAPLKVMLLLPAKCHVVAVVRFQPFAKVRGLPVVLSRVEAPLKPKLPEPRAPVLPRFNVPWLSVGCRQWPVVARQGQGAHA